MLFGRHINKYYLRYSPMLLLGLAALIIVDYFQLLIPEIYRSVINGISTGSVTVDSVVYEFNIEFLLDKICLPLILVIVALVVGRFAWRICFFGSAIRVETDLRRRMFDHCKDLSQSYYQVNKVGGMMSLFTNDLRTVEECFGSGILSLLDAVLMGSLAIFKMFKMNAVLTLLSLVPMALLIVVATIVRKYMMRKWALRQEAFSALSDFAQESFSGIAVIKAFVKEAKELWAFKKLNKQNENANVDHTRASTILHIFVTLFVESVICVILGYGGYLVYHGIFNAGEFVEFIGYFNAIVWPITAISMLIEMQSRGKASLNRISELLDAEIDVKDADGVCELENVQGEIEFKGLTFRHPGASYDALSDINLKINAGERVGIIGKTGSGKTTIVDLILRTYNVENGTLFVDGQDVNSVSIKSLRKYCAYVPQDNFLFSDTIENNIAFATDDGSISVEDASKYADIHENIVDFSNGYKTVLGERGVTVSGGQKQRISIARALMKNAPILILDDSVSAVDTKTEKIIIENLNKIRQGKTTIMIAHRVSTIEKMDKIVYLDNGQIVDVGTHEELYERCREYKNMVELQRLDEERGAE